MDAIDAGRRKLTLGRRKIEMKKIEKETSLQVAFSKRRSGLFKKAGELAVLCGSDIAIIVQSPENKLFTFGSPSVESVLHRFETGNVMSDSRSNGSNGTARNNYVKEMRKLEEEKKQMAASTTEFWWDQPIDGMELEELERHFECLNAMRSSVRSRVEETEKRRLQPSSSSCSSSQNNYLAPFPVYLDDYDREIFMLLND